MYEKETLSLMVLLLLLITMHTVVEQHDENIK